MKKLKFFLLINLALINIFSINISYAEKDQIEHKDLIEKGNQVSIVVIPNYHRIKPVVLRAGKTVTDYVKENNAIAGINGGYFNYSNGYPVSYILIDCKIQEDPKKNKDLVSNPELQTILPKIFNKRSEFRIIKKDNSIFYNISSHDYDLPKEYQLIDSVQAGPNLLPVPQLEEEGFIIKNKSGQIIRDGISSQTRAARSAVGLDKSGNVYFIAVSAKSKKHGLNIEELSDLTKKLNLVSAMNLDGGKSTTLVWRDKNQYKTFVGNGKEPARVNSALLVF